MAVENSKARDFYEEAIWGGWSVRQLDRQISTQFHERLIHAKNPTALLEKTVRLNQGVPCRQILKSAIHTYWSS